MGTAGRMTPSMGGGGPGAEEPAGSPGMGGAMGGEEGGLALPPYMGRKGQLQQAELAGAPAGMAGFGGM